ncbi:MAG: NTP transferase domain-containing protein [Myxococcales bacterium]|nr:MAG: NTP transferase domain-containing protein [Myxococcales bacterium]
MVLAAGFGTRLRPLSELLPKPVVPVAGRPVISFALETLSMHGIRDIAVNSHYLSDELREHMQGFVPPDVNLAFFHEQKILGTAGGLKNARAFLLDSTDPDDAIVVFNGKLVYQPDLSSAIALHKQSGAIATMLLQARAEGSHYGAIDLRSDGKVCGILRNEEPVDPALKRCMFTGVHILSKQAIEQLPDAGCVIRQGYVPWLERGETIVGMLDSNPWHEVSTPTSYFEANMSLLEDSAAWPSIQLSGSNIIDKQTMPLSRDIELDRCIIGKNVSLTEGIKLSRCIVWPRSQIRQSVTNSIITPKHRLTMDRE